MHRHHHPYDPHCHSNHVHCHDVMMIAHSPFPKHKFQMAWVDVAGDVDGTTFRFGMNLPTNTLGPLIASYLTERPTELNTCSIPCPGPCGSRWRQGYGMVLQMRWYCRCDGNGVCRLSSDLGRFRTLRCNCQAGCLDRPYTKWNENAWCVLLVLCKWTPSTYRASRTAAHRETL